MKALTSDSQVTKTDVTADNFWSNGYVRLKFPETPGVNEAMPTTYKGARYLTATATYDAESESWSKPVLVALELENSGFAFSTFGTNGSAENDHLAVRFIKCDADGKIF